MRKRWATAFQKFSMPLRKQQSSARIYARFPSTKDLYDLTRAERHSLKLVQCIAKEIDPAKRHNLYLKVFDILRSNAADEHITDAILAVDPEHAKARLVRGYLCVKQDRLREAEIHICKGLLNKEVSKKYYLTVETLAVALFKNRQLQEARFFFEEVLKLQENNAKAIAHLKLIKEAENDLVAERLKKLEIK